MAGRQTTITVDQDTARALQQRAADRGVSVAELVAMLATSESTPASVSGDGIAELNRRWQQAQSGEAVAHAEVVEWLETWGSGEYAPWPRR